jgi:uncharacterized membrane protein
VSLIDQRILIVAPADAVWSHLTATTTLPKWNRLTKQLSVLSTHDTGVGARRRCTDDRGRTTVEQITAWVENIGCEYIMVDGPYRSLKGRVRLQAVADGTIVNWTVDYQLKGPLAGMRNVLLFRRGYQRMMADSLRELRKVVEKSGVKLDPEKQARFAMQADPGIEARAARNTPDGKLTPRAERVVLPPGQRPNLSISIADDESVGEPIPMQPSAVTVPNAAINLPVAVGAEAAALTSAPLPNSPPAILHAFTAPPLDGVSAETPALMPMPQPAFVSKLEAEVAPAMVIPEPPITQEDTRPRKAVKDAEPLPPPDLVIGGAESPVSTFAGIIEPPIDAEDTPPSGTGRQRALQAQTAAERTEANAEVAAHFAPTVPISLVAPPAPPATVTQTMEVVAPEAPPASAKTYTPPRITAQAPLSPPMAMPPESLPERVPTPPMIRLEALRPPPTSGLDTGEVSIWDVFGLESPTQRGIAVLNEVVAQARATAEMDAVTPPSSVVIPEPPPDHPDEATVLLNRPGTPGAALLASFPPPPTPAPVPPSALSRRATIRVRAWTGSPRKKVRR